MRNDWTMQTMQVINQLTPKIKGKAFDPDWFLLRQRFEQIEAKLAEQGIEWDGEKFGNYILNSLDKCAGVKYYTDMMDGGNMTISMYTVPPYSDSFSPFVTLQDAHFKTFNAAESQTAQRARGQYLRGLRILESAFNYLQEQGVAANVERLNKLVRRLNPEQFVTVDVDSLVHLLAAWKMLEKLPESVRREYSIASELDADK